MWEFDWTQAGVPALAAFLGSLVEFVEALTVVLAVGSVRGWRGALGGAGLGLIVLLFLVATLGPALTRIPIAIVQLIVGALLLLFGLRWLRKAILRAAGMVPLHDEEATFASETQSLQRGGQVPAGWDKLAVAAAFKIVMLEGIEVVFIVIAVGAAGGGDLIPASAVRAAPPVVQSSGSCSIGPSPRSPRTLSNLPSAYCSPPSGRSGSAKAWAWPGPAMTGQSGRWPRLSWHCTLRGTTLREAEGHAGESANRGPQQ